MCLFSFRIYTNISKGIRPCIVLPETVSYINIVTSNKNVGYGINIQLCLNVKKKIKIEKNSSYHSILLNFLLCIISLFNNPAGEFFNSIRRTKYVDNWRKNNTFNNWKNEIGWEVK